MIVRGDISAGVPTIAVRDLDAGTVYEGVAVAGFGGVCRDERAMRDVMRLLERRREALVVLTKYRWDESVRASISRWELVLEEAA